MEQNRGGTHILYQKILMDNAPYMIRFGRLERFTEHRHADIEFIYCFRDSFDIIIDKKRYTVKEGEIALVSPMVSHEIPEMGDTEHMVLTTVVGSVFLKKHFKLFSRAEFASPVCSLCDFSENHVKIRELLEEIAQFCMNPTAHSDLIVTGNLYKICAYLLDGLSVPKDDGETEKKDLRKVENIEKALELIYNEYSKALTVDDAAAITGYGKSNFCKIFKNVVGDSFHTVLNKRRVYIAYELLKQTDLPISVVAQEVGFPEPKSFCRVFKSITGMTPGAYRNAYAE
ncbi:MAG: helix-turn-helix domain-containing protein [Clostridia bacterium]|nr:helix-turn-helix domain-containing protein [Clostridia bacterium]